MRPQALIGYIIGACSLAVLGIIGFFNLDLALTVYMCLIILSICYSEWMNRFAKRFSIGPTVILIKSHHLYETYLRYAHYLHFSTQSLFISGFLGPFALSSIPVTIFLLYKGFYVKACLHAFAYIHISNLITIFDPVYLDKNRVILVPQFEKILAILNLGRAKEKYDAEKKTYLADGNEVPPPIPLA